MIHYIRMVGPLIAFTRSSSFTAPTVPAPSATTAHVLYLVMITYLLTHTRLYLLCWKLINE